MSVSLAIKKSFEGFEYYTKKRTDAAKRVNPTGLSCVACLPVCGLLRRNGARLREMADSRVLATARHIHICLRVVLAVSASLPLHAPPLPPSSRRYAPQCFVGGYASSPCAVSRCASDEPRRCMSLSSALDPSSLPHLPLWRVSFRSFCARRRSVDSLSNFCTRPHFHPTPIRP